MPLAFVVERPVAGHAKWNMLASFYLFRVSGALSNATTSIKYLSSLIAYTAHSLPVAQWQPYLRQWGARFAF